MLICVCVFDAEMNKKRFGRAPARCVDQARKHTEQNPDLEQEVERRGVGEEGAVEVEKVYVCVSI